MYMHAGTHVMYCVHLHVVVEVSYHVSKHNTILKECYVCTCIWENNGERERRRKREGGMFI